MNADSQIKWMDWRHLPAFAALLADRFAAGKAMARLRFAAKLLLTPHLRLGREALIGLVPVGVGRAERLRRGVLWLLTPRGMYERAAVPVALKNCDIRVVNLASVPGVRARALRLGREVCDFADANGIRLVADARLDDDRLAEIYRAHGFVNEGSESSTSLRMQRIPTTRVTPARDRLSVLRTGRLTVDFFEQVFGQIPWTSGEIVLDVGAGDSPLATQISRDSTVLGVMVDVDYAHCPPAGDRHHSVAAAAARLPFKPMSADHIIFTFCLQHVDNVTAAIIDACRVATRGGRLFIYPLWGRRACARVAGLAGVQVLPPPTRLRAGRRPAIIEARYVDRWNSSEMEDFVSATRPPALIVRMSEVAMSWSVALTGTPLHRKIGT